MFEALSDRLSGVLTRLTGKGALSEDDVKTALPERLGRSLGDDYYFVAGGKALNDGNGTTLGALGVVGRGCVLELRRRTAGAAARPKRRPMAQCPRPAPWTFGRRRARPTSPRRRRRSPSR